MKLLDAQLLASTGTSYDQTRTTLAGRVTQRTVDGKPVLGPSPTRFLDVFSDTGVAPITTMFPTENGRLFCIGAIASGAIPIILYEINASTGVHTYIGRINVAVPASPAIVHTIRSIRALDSGTTGWKIYIVATGTVLLGGSGVLLANNINRSDFSQVSPPTIPFATGNNQKAVYQLGRLPGMQSLAITPTLGTPVKFNWASHGFSNNDQVYFTSQVGPAWTVSTFAVNTKYFVRNASLNDFELSATFNGASIAAAAGPTSVVMQPLNQEIDAFGSIIDPAANRLYTHIGSAANPQYFVRDTSVNPTYPTQTGNITIGAPGKIQITSHGYTENEPVQFLAGSLPAAFALNTTYFVRSVTANDFELSATAGGTGITTATAATGVTVGRAFGYTNSQWLHSTSILPAISGTLLSTVDVDNLAAPTNAPLNGGVLNGQKCAFFATSSNLYLGRLDELTPGATTWPSLTTSNMLGTPSQIVTPVVVTAAWSTTLDHAVVLIGQAATNAFRFMLKKVENNKLTGLFGDVCMEFFETTTKEAYELRPSVPYANFAINNGWLFAISTATGQRGVFAADIRSDALTDFSSIVSRVLTLPQNTILKSIQVMRELIKTGGEIGVQYRLSGFGSISGGWIDVDADQELSIISGTQIQFKLLFKTFTFDRTSHCQVSDLFVGYDTGEDLSDNWEYSFDDSSSGTPTRVGFRLKQAYGAAIPSTLSFRAYDLSGVLLVDHDITNEASNFQYSTDGGNTWLPLGTIPNTVGTLVRYTFTSPPGVDIRPSLKDS
ncbi:hypothetical protein EBZ38_05965 [bacterium]|nr:hypothetical protein [bacterium]